MFYIIRYYNKQNGVWKLMHDKFEDIETACEFVKSLERCDIFTFVSMKKVG